MTDVRAIAYYLPQFHPIPENDRWWGRGFTEWTNVTKAKPMFRGHVQPKLPTDLGFYDLRLPETREQQAKLARKVGVESFLYWHYWFAGKRLLERPFDEVLSSGQPDFGFCLAWANESWTGIWHGAPSRVLIEQTYPGEDDHRRHFESLLPAFTDPRYTTVDGKPLFYIYRPENLPDQAAVVDIWRRCADKAGLPGLFLISETHSGDVAIANGFDGYVTIPSLRALSTTAGLRGGVVVRARKALGRPRVGSYATLSSALRSLAEAADDRSFPCVVTGWDNTPRSGLNGIVLKGCTPGLFRDQLRVAASGLSTRPQDRRLLFVKSWNEWAEGNHVEPDDEWGDARLRAMAEVLIDSSNSSGTGG